MPLTYPTSPELPVEWLISPDPVDYEAAILCMETRVAAIRAGTASELIWLLEHPALYTAGTSAKAEDLLSPNRFQVYATGRGGQYTYHGPGQRVVYVMLDVKRRGADVRAFVTELEHWLIEILAHFDITGRTHGDRVGVWVSRADREEKIAAIGIRLRKWVSYHGMSLNVNPNLEHFAGIVPCGLSAYGVTSLADLSCSATMNDVDLVIRRVFERRFGPTQLIPGNIVASDLAARN